jgi:uncharacterized membrane protein
LRDHHYERKFMLRKTMVVFAIALALGGYTLPTTVFAADSTFEGGRGIAGRAKAAHHSGRSLDRHGYEFNGYDSQWRSWGGHAHEWDPWGHWGAYYGPNPAPL